VESDDLLEQKLDRRRSFELSLNEQPNTSVEIASANHAEIALDEVLCPNVCLAQAAIVESTE
jgi:hypothetical protein